MCLPSQALGDFRVQPGRVLCRGWSSWTCWAGSWVWCRRSRTCRRCTSHWSWTHGCPCQPCGSSPWRMRLCNPKNDHYLRVYQLLNTFIFLRFSWYLFIHLFVFISGFMSICSYIHLYFCTSIFLFICLSVYLSLCVSVSLFLCLSVYLSLCLSVSLFICISGCLSIRLSVCPCIHLYLYISACL